MIDAFRSLTAIAAPLPIANIDTDMLVPAAFLKTVSREGLGRALFHAARFDDDDRERPDFVLNRVPWRRAQILVALDNFGCGSSREHAPWALLDFGIRCVVATSFADIFYSNCFKNGILPIRLDRTAVDRLLADAADPDNATFQVDLESCVVASGSGLQFGFEIDPQRRHRLLHGLDDIAISLAHAADIARFEAASRAARPWLPDVPAHP